MNCYSPFKTNDVKNKYNKKNNKEVAEDLISTAIQRIENRAKVISESEKSKDLWDYFFQNGLCRV